MNRHLWLFVIALISAGCTGVPEGITPVDDFDAERYMGRWYEIARLDHSFERGLEQVTAEYRLTDKGGIEVVNRGYAISEGKWEEAQGKAYFVDSPKLGHLKVSFFGPFYSSYVIFELGDDYDYAFVTGVNKKYLWLLARQPEVSDALRQNFIQTARERGFPTDELIFVNHRRSVPPGADEGK